MITIMIHLFIVSITTVFSLRNKEHIQNAMDLKYPVYLTLIIAGAALSSISFIAKAVADFTAPSTAPLQSLHNLAVYTEYTSVIAVLLVFPGIAVLLKRLNKRPSNYVFELEKKTDKLYTSNYILNKTLNSRNQELENNSLQLQKLLTKHHASRMALLKSERKFRTLFDESPAIFASVDKRLTLSDINAFGARTLGHDVASLLGRCFSRIVAPSDQLDIEIFLANFFSKTNPKQQTEARLIREDKTTIWVKITGSLISQNHGERHLLLVCQDISTLKGLEAKLSFQAQHDPLTGLLNRYAMETKLDALLASTQHHKKQSLAFIYFDVDQIKVVNDTCGHLAGDELLKQLTELIRDQIPQVDCFARIGGDEFAVIKTNCNRDKAYELASLVRNIAEDFTFVWNGKRFRQSVSVGVALSSPKICTATAIIGTSDAACYAAKGEGRNRVVLLENDMETSLGNRGEMLWVSRLQEAVIKNRFELYFQPIVPLNDIGSPYVHYEILVRYVNERSEHQPPSSFLSAAERFGLADQIDLWVLTTTLDFLEKHPAHTRILDCCSINLTSHSLASYRTRSAILQLINSIRFPTNKICFEITETSVISNLSEVADFIKDLKALGCRFALDDFGTGFSSFGYLKKLDVDYIKIDGCFVRDIKMDGIDRAIVTAIKSIGHTMEIKVVAEYVENNTIINQLTAMDITYGQGYGLAIPMPIEEVETYYSFGDQSFLNTIQCQAASGKGFVR